MYKVLISLASNHQQEENLSRARIALAQVLHSPSYTPAIWTEPVGADTSPASPRSPIYLNQLVCATTTLDSDQLTEQLKSIERTMGRDEEARRAGIVPIDLDLLQHDRQRFHLRDWGRHYIQRLLPLIRKK